MKACLCFSILVALTTSAFAQSRFFRPSRTDSAIDGKDAFHFYGHNPSIAQRDKLVVFFPGTTAVPFNYQEFVNHCASLGFHALGLSYENDEAINQLCATNAPADPACHGLAREEVITGQDRVAFLDISPANSIDNRLQKAIAHLHRNQPTAGWGHYLADGAVDWEKVIVAGHSQGAGHAAYLAKTRRVSRCLVFAGLDLWVAGDRVADWMSLPSTTPVGNIYLLAHERDELISLADIGKGAEALDILRFGAALSVDGATDFQGRHFLTTNTGSQGRFHGAMIVDGSLARDGGGTPTMIPAWTHMLLNETPKVGLRKVDGALEIAHLPGQLETATDPSSEQSWSEIATPSPITFPLISSETQRFFRLVESSEDSSF